MLGLCLLGGSALYAQGEAPEGAGTGEELGWNSNAWSGTNQTDALSLTAKDLSFEKPELDQLRLKGGGILTGTILRETDLIVKIELEKYGILTLKKADIAEIAHGKKVGPPPAVTPRPTPVATPRPVWMRHSRLDGDNVTFELFEHIPLTPGEKSSDPVKGAGNAALGASVMAADGSEIDSGMVTEIADHWVDLSGLRSSPDYEHGLESIILKLDANELLATDESELMEALNARYELSPGDLGVSELKALSIMLDEELEAVPPVAAADEGTDVEEGQAALSPVSLTLARYESAEFGIAFDYPDSWFVTEMGIVLGTPIVVVLSSDEEWKKIGPKFDGRGILGTSEGEAPTSAKYSYSGAAMTITNLGPTGKRQTLKKFLQQRRIMLTTSTLLAAGTAAQPLTEAQVGGNDGVTARFDAKMSDGSALTALVWGVSGEMKMAAGVLALFPESAESKYAATLEAIANSIVVSPFNAP